MKATNLTFETKDVVKLVGFILVVSSMWYDLKSDLRVFKATIELRVGQLEKQQDRRYKDIPETYALVPNETKLTDEN
jgi:chaperonin cofactor prefoldin